MAPLSLLAAFAALVPTLTAPESTFVLSVARGEAVETVRLTCEPAGGNHPNADRACTALSSVNGEIPGLADDAAVCTLQYDPVTVIASGMWRGEVRRFSARYNNPCLMRADTGPVFDFQR